MKKNKGLILGGLLLAITVLLSSVALPAMAGEAYDFDCRDVVKSYGYTPQWVVYDNPTTIVPDCYGGAIVTTNIDDIWCWPIELGSVPGCNLLQKQDNIKDDMLERKTGVYFYIHGQGYYPAIVDIQKRTISVHLNANQVPESGTEIGWRFWTLLDDDDQMVHFSPPGMGLINYTVPGPGDEISLSRWAWTVRYGYY